MEIKDVKITLKEAEAAALLYEIPISIHRGVSITPPPKPASPPRKPATKLSTTVLLKTKLN